ncbi:MAG: sodium:proton antiporter NhaD, partial [Desulfobacterales bacterium]|nr:sodium:proton antiporter NhaD [Desulfobacterales bacterium]
MKRTVGLLTILLMPMLAWAEGGHGVATSADLTGTVYGYLGVIVFVLAYALVPLENTIHLRKSKPVLLAAGIVWMLLAIAYIRIGDTHTAHEAIKHSLLEYAELFLFLLAAMTYINAMEERNVFQSLRAVLVSRGLSLRMIFWVTGALAFLISPIADNLTTALLMGAVVMAVGGDNKKFVALACINVVVAANAGGAFSPFGDITTLMVWQKGKVQFSEFFNIFFPSLVNWLIPAVVMSLAIEKGAPKTIDEIVEMKYGAKAIMAFFLVTIATAVCFHNFLHLPPVAGMMLGLGFLGPLSYHIKLHEGRSERYPYILGARGAESVYPITTIVKSKLDLSAIIEKISLPAFTIDTNHMITYWNKACETFTGLTAKEMVGTRDQWKPFYESEQPVMADLVLNYMPEMMIDHHYEGNFQRNEYIDGAYEASRFVPTLGKEGRWVSFSGAPLKDETGNLVGAVEVLQDYTDK